MPIVTGLHARAVKAATKGLGVRDGVLAPRPHRRRSGTSARPTRVWRCATCSSGPSRDRSLPSCRSPTGPTPSCCGRLTHWPRRSGPAPRRACRRSAEQIEAGRDDLGYAAFLTWRGQMHREPPRRPDPERPGAPTVHRSEEWKYAFAASRCMRVRLPPHASHAGLLELPRHRPDAGGAPGRRAGHGGDVHDRPSGLLAVATGHRRDHRLRRGRPVPLRDDRRPARRAFDRRPGRHDVPARVDGAGRAQLLLESAAAGGRHTAPSETRRSKETRDNGEQRHPRPGGHHRHGLHPLR